MTVTFDDPEQSLQHILTSTGLCRDIKSSMPNFVALASLSCILASINFYVIH